MSRLAQSWVEENFGFAKPLDIERDFSNGFLFLTILFKKKVVSEDDIQNAVNDYTPHGVITNMNILGNALQLLGIHFNKRMVANVRT